MSQFFKQKKFSNTSEKNEFPSKEKISYTSPKYQFSKRRNFLYLPEKTDFPLKEKVTYT